MRVWGLGKLEGGKGKELMVYFNLKKKNSKACWYVFRFCIATILFPLARASEYLKGYKGLPFIIQVKHATGDWKQQAYNLGAFSRSRWKSKVMPTFFAPPGEQFLV